MDRKLRYQKQGDRIDGKPQSEKSVWYKSLKIASRISLIKDFSKAILKNNCKV